MDDAKTPMSERRTFDIIMLANGHPVFDTRIFVKEARTLVASGYSVCIMLPAEKSVVRDGVAVIALPLALAGWRKLVVNPFVIFRAALRQPKSSVFCIHDSDILLTGVLLKLTGRKVVYDAHEDTPLQIRYQHWIPKWLRKPYAVYYRLLERVCGWMFDRIIVAEPVIARYFPPKKTFLVRNFPIADTFQRHPQRPHPTRKPRLVYVGSLTAVRGLHEMLEAAQRAASEVDFEFVLGGQFSPARLEHELLPRYNAVFTGWLSYDALVNLLFDSQVGMIIPHPLERYKTNYPVKLFEYMAAGLPVIASVQGESAAFVKEANCGILVNPRDVDEVSEAIKWLFRNPGEAAAMGLRGQALIYERYNWERESAVLLAVYEELVNGSSR